MDWNKFDNGVYLVNVLAIVYNKKTRMILIGRRENDPYIKELTWCFPGGRAGYDKDLEEYLKVEVKKKTGIEIDVKGVIFTRTFPEDRHFLLIYYYAEYTCGKEKPAEGFVELKWIRPMEVKKYFTTSIHPKLFKFLKKLEDES